MRKPRRAIRRHHLARLKAKWLRIILTHWSLGLRKDDREEWARQLANRYATTGKPCSCSGCGNPRHSAFGKGKDRLTMQERKINHKPIQENEDE